MAKLMCTTGLNAGDEFSLREGATIIGRVQDVQVMLFDKKCSRHHCQLVKKGAYYSVADMGSQNGTFLNDHRVTKAVSMKVGDKIRIGKTILALSEKPVGSLEDQAMTDAAADLQAKDYSTLAKAAVDDVRQQQHDAKAAGTRTGLSALLHRFFAAK